MIQNEKCIRCGRKLRTYSSKLLGYGPSCYKAYLNSKLKIKQIRRLF